MKKQITLRKMTLLVAVLLWGTGAEAQVSLYKDGVLQGSLGQYTDIKAALGTSNANVPFVAAGTRAYVIELESNYSGEATYPLTLTAVTNASSTNTITIRPAVGAKVTIGNPNTTSIFTNVTTETTSAVLTVAQSTSNVTAGMTVYGYGPFISTSAHPTVSTGGVTANTITCSRNMSTAVTGTATIYVGTPNTKTILFDGADYITIDGVSRTAANTGLTIQNPNNIQSSTIWFQNSSANNTIQNCFVKGANVSGMAYNNGGCGQIMFYSGNNDFNTITNNDICDIDGLPMPICFLLLTYDSNASNNDNTISNNNIYNLGNGTSPNGNTQVIGFSSTGNVNSFNNYILNNRIFWTKTAVFRTNPYIFGMGSTYNGLGNRIEGNTIGWQADGTTRAEITAPLNTSLTFYGSNVKNCTFKNNVIGGINYASKTFVGFQIFGHNTSSPNEDDVCYGNQVKDITINSSVTGANFYGIMVTATSPFTFNVKNNIVKSIIVSSPTAANTSTIQGILYNFGAPTPLYNVNCIGNEVSNITAGNVGSSAANNIIAFVQGGPAGLIEKNLIYNLNSISTGTTSVIKGLRFALSNANGATIKNNIIRIGTGISSDVEIHGIFHEGTSSDAHTFNFYHNTIYIGGTSATKNTHVFTHTGALKGLVSLKNNIFSNVRSGGSAVNDIYNLVTNTDITMSEYNMYQYNGQFAYTLTTPATTSYATIDAWKGVKTTFETGSINQTNPLFVDPTNATTPNLQVNSSSPAILAGADLSATVTNDFIGTIRKSRAGDIGAYAVLQPGYFTGTGNWSTVDNWDNGILPTVSDNVTIPSVKSVTVDVTSATCNNITLQPGTQLTLNDTKTLAVSGSFTLQSDATNGIATFTDLNAASGLTVTGTANVQQWLTGKSGTSTRGIWYLSSPVSAATAAVFDVAAGTNKMTRYDETKTPNPGYITLFTDNATSLTPGVGYVAQIGGADAAYTFSTSTGSNSAKLNSGSMPITVTRTGTTAAKRGFNLVGNPYPSYLDWKHISNTKTNLRSTIWYRVYDGNQMTFDTYDGTTGTGNGEKGAVSQYIPPMQAFWVKVDKDGDVATLAFANAARLHRDQSLAVNSLRAPAQKNTEPQIVRLRVSNGTNSDETILVADANATDAFDTYDSEKMNNDNAAIPEIYTLAGTQELVINHLSDFATNKQIALGFRPGTISNFSIVANEINNVAAQTKVILIDKLQNNAEFDLTNGTAYTFSADATPTADRFVIAFRAPGVATNLSNANNFNMFVYSNANNQITINRNSDVKAMVTVCNALGQKLVSTPTTGSTTVIQKSLGSGVYYVSLTAEGNESTQKVIIK